ncbi:MAG: hypothetical protein V1720_01645 [bacterium]
MRRIIRYILFTIILVILPLNQAAAQDFKKIIAIVVEMENSLKQLIANEESARQADFTSLKNDIEVLQQKIDQIPAGLDDSTTVDLKGLAARVAQIEAKVKNLPDVNGLVLQLNQLIGELKTAIQTAPTPVQTTPPLFNIKTGILLQAHAQAIQEGSTVTQDADPNYTQHWQRQLFVRRIRVILGGDIAKNTSFFFETDAPNIGKLTGQGVKDTKFTMYIQDAYIQHSFMPELSVIAGLQLVGISRNGLQSAASLMGLDYGSYQFLTSGPLDNSAGRDFGVNLRGFLFDERLEYRAGMFSGKSTNPYSPFRVASRFNYSFFDKEKGIFYPGTTLGKGQIVSVGAGFDMQRSYSAFSFDGFADLPLGSPGSVTFSSSFTLLDGGGSDTDSTMFTGSIPKQSIFFGELGYFFKDLNLQPYVKYEVKDVNATVLKQVGATTATLEYVNQLKSSQRFGVGLNYFITGHNANVKILYEILMGNRASLTAGVSESYSTGLLTIQLQYFTF